MGKRLTIVFLFLSLYGFSQSNGDYRTIGSGAWSNIAIWQRFTNQGGGNWVAATAAPDGTNFRIDIQAGNVVALATNVTSNQLVISGTLTVGASGVLNIANSGGATVELTLINGSALTVNGTMNRENGTTVSNASGITTVFGANAVLNHNLSASLGDMFLATWDPTATINISSLSMNAGNIYTANATWNQVYGNINVGANANHRGILDFAGNVQTILGNVVINVGTTGVVRFATNQALNLSIGTLGSAVGGNMSVLGTSRVTFSESGTATIDIHNNLTINSSNTNLSFLTLSGTATLNVHGNLTMQNGRLGLTSTAGTGTVNLYKDLSVATTAIISSTAGAGNLNFVGTGTQTLTNTSATAITGNISWYIAPTSILNAGTSLLTGNGTFVLGGTIRLGSLDGTGAISDGTAAGNIRIPTANRTYQTGSTIVYAGLALQFLGSAHPTNTDVNTIIDNASGVRLASNATIGGPLTLQNGNLDLNNFTLTTTGTITPVNGRFAGTNASILVVGGTNAGSIGSIPFAPGFNNLSTLTINLTGAAASVTSPSALNIATALNLIDGQLIATGVITMASGSLVTRYDTGSLTGNEVTTLPGELYNLTYTSATVGASVITPGLELTTDPAKLGNLTIAFSEGVDDLQLDQDITINGTFSLDGGRIVPVGFDITMNGGQWLDNAGTYNAGVGTVFFNSNTSVGGTSDPNFGSIQVNADMTVTFTRDFTVRRNVTIVPNAVFDMADFTMTLFGSNSQAISANGATLSNILIDKTGSNVTLTSALNISGSIQFSGTSVGSLVTGGFLTLLSTSDGAGSGTAYIGEIPDGYNVTGAIDVQRFMSGEGRLYRYLSSPVAAASVQDLKDAFPVTGTFTDPSPKQALCNFIINPTSPSLFIYNESVAGDISLGYVAYPASGLAASNFLEVGRGYAAFVRQCSVPQTIHFTGGTINSGPINLPVSFTPSGDVAGDGWNLVGNPYPCVIGWDEPGWTKTNIASAIAITDNSSGTAVLRYYDPGVVEDFPNGEIALGQGFWARATGGGPQLGVTEPVKVHTVSEFFRATPIPAIKLAVSNGTKQDFMYIKTVPGAKAALDDFDAPKITNPTPMFSVSTVAEGNIPMAINAVEALSCGDIIPLKSSGLTEGNYTVNLDKRGFFNHLQFVLVDKFTQEEKVLDTDSFSFNVSADPGSKALDRFTLKVQENQNLPALEVLNADACKDIASVSVGTTLQDVSYSLWSTNGQQLSAFVKGTGQPMNIPISGSLLTEGENEVVVKAGGFCTDALAVSGSFVINKAMPTVTAESKFNCKSGSVLLAASSNTTGATINWYERQNDLVPVFSGASFETGELSKNKTYFVEAVTASGCTSERTSVTTDIYEFTAPTLQAEGTKLVSSTASGNQWYFEGTLLNKDDVQSISMVKTGNYQLSVTIKGCVFNLDYVLEDAGISGLEVFPVPFSNSLNLRRIGDEVEKIELINSIGKNMGLVYTRGQAFSGTVDTSTIAPGVYFIKVYRGGQTYTYRLVKE